MILQPAIAAMLASGLSVPEAPKLLLPRPAIVRPGSIDVSKHMLLGMPLTMGMLPGKARDPYFIGSSSYSTTASSSLEVLTWSHTTTADTTAIVVSGAAVNNANSLDMDFVSFNGVSFGTYIAQGGSGDSVRIFVLFNPPVGTYTLRAEVDATNDRFFAAHAINLGGVSEVNAGNGAESTSAETLSVSLTTTKRSIVIVGAYAQVGNTNIPTITCTSPAGGTLTRSASNASNNLGKRFSMFYTDARDAGAFSATMQSSLTITRTRIAAVALAA